MSFLNIGDQAPLFSTTDHEGNKINLIDFRGQKVVVFFYPQDDTPNCTKEVCNLRDNYQVLKDAGFVLLGISKDSVESHQAFVQKFNLPFPLLMDESGEIIESYGAWGEKNMYGKKYMGIFRYTFVINELGTIVKIFKKVKTEDHSNQILALKF